MRRRYDNHVHDSTYLSRDKLSDAAKAYDLIAEVSCDTGKHLQRYTSPRTQVMPVRRRRTKRPKACQLARNFDTCSGDWPA